MAPSGPSATLVQAAEETRARMIMRDPDNKADSPAYECESYREQLPDVQLMRETYGGTKTMRACGKKFLPQHPMETDSKYAARVAQAVAYNAVRKTVEGLSGMIFRRDPSPSDDMPELVKTHLENIDLRGNKLAVFLRLVADNALLDGHTWVHIETPPTGGYRNAREAENAGVRPYWINVKKSQAINWRYVIRGGKPVLTLFVYREGHTAAAGEFGEEKRERIRVLREGPAGQVLGEVWELQDKEVEGKQVKRWVLIQEYSIGINVLPVVFVPSERSGIFESRPPLLDLAYEQIEYYRVRSDRQKSLTFSSIAVPYVFGQNVTDEEGTPKVKWGADGMLLLNDPEASAGMLESQGFGLEATKEELVAIKENIASLGLRMLMRQPGTQPATATADILNKSESNASLATFAVALEDSTNLGLQIHAAYESTVQTPGTVAVNRDFHEQLMDPQFIQVMADLVASGKLSLDTLWAMLVEGEVLPEDFDPEEERSRIQKDGAAGLLELFGAGAGGRPASGGEGGAAGDGTLDDEEGAGTGGTRA